MKKALLTIFVFALVFAPFSTYAQTVSTSTPQESRISLLKKELALLEELLSILTAQTSTTTATVTAPNIAPEAQNLPIKTITTSTLANVSGVDSLPTLDCEITAQLGTKTAYIDGTSTVSYYPAYTWSFPAGATGTITDAQGTGTLTQNSGTNLSVQFPAGQTSETFTLTVSEDGYQDSTCSSTASE
jgi:hypothetical protein